MHGTSTTSQRSTVADQRGSFMANGLLPVRLSRRSRWFLGPNAIKTFWVVALLATLVLSACVAAWTWRVERSAALDRAEASASQFSSGLLTVLDKFRLLAPLLSQNEELIKLYFGNQNTPSTLAVLNTIRGMSGARQIRFLDLRGVPVAASDGFGNIADYPSEAGQPYFVEAMQGRLGRGHSLQENERLYHFASAVRVGAQSVGVVVIDVSLSLVEQNWALSANPVFAVDPDDVIFMGNREAWILRLFNATANLEGSIVASAPFWDWRLVTLVGDVVTGSPYFLQARKTISILGWDLYVLTDVVPIINYVATVTAFCSLSCLLLTGIAWAMLWTRRTAFRAQRLDRAQALRLERKVRDRTSALTSTNEALAREIEERRITERELHLTQAELLHSAKLAAIGQTSAALSHEFNQPLAAIRFNAENATELLSRGDPDRTREKLERIVKLVDRMGKISKMLRIFASRTKVEIEPVELAKVLDEVALMMATRFEDGQVLLTVNVPRTLTVAADVTGLTQIFSNLIGNACEAVAGSPTRRIEIDAFSTRSGYAVVRVADTGPGIATEHRSRLFEPFFTTKSVGNGLGLGLSIVREIVKSYGGTIGVSSRVGRGVTFKMRLPMPNSSQIRGR